MSNGITDKHKGRVDAISLFEDIGGLSLPTKISNSLPSNLPKRPHTIPNQSAPVSFPVPHSHLPPKPDVSLAPAVSKSTPPTASGSVTSSTINQFGGSGDLRSRLANESRKLQESQKNSTQNSPQLAPQVIPSTTITTAKTTTIRNSSPIILSSSSEPDSPPTRHARLPVLPPPISARPSASSNCRLILEKLVVCGLPSEVLGELLGLLTNVLEETTALETYKKRTELSKEAAKKLEQEHETEEDIMMKELDEILEVHKVSVSLPVTSPTTSTTQQFLTKEQLAALDGLGSNFTAVLAALNSLENQVKLRLPRSPFPPPSLPLSAPTLPIPTNNIPSIPIVVKPPTKTNDVRMPILPPPSEHTARPASNHKAKGSFSFPPEEPSLITTPPPTTTTTNNSASGSASTSNNIFARISTSAASPTLSSATPRGNDDSYDSRKSSTTKARTDDRFANPRDVALARSGRIPSLALPSKSQNLLALAERIREPGEIQTDSSQYSSSSNEYIYNNNNISHQNGPGNDNRFAMDDTRGSPVPVPSSSHLFNQGRQAPPRRSPSQHRNIDAMDTSKDTEYGYPGGGGAARGPRNSYVPDPRDPIPLGNRMAGGYSTATNLSPGGKSLDERTRYALPRRDTVADTQRGRSRSPPPRSNSNAGW